MATNEVSTSTPTPKEQVIIARREEDGFITFSVKISHIVEQTLLRAFNRPNFRKSVIKVVDEADHTAAEDGQASTEVTPGLSPPPVTSANSQSVALVPAFHSTDQSQSKSDKDDSSIIPTGTSEHSGSDECKTESERNAQNYVSKTDTATFSIESLSSIPSSWLSRGISSEQKIKFEKSIENASLCPYERKKAGKATPNDDEDKGWIPSLSTSYNEEYSSDPFSPATSPVSPHPPPHRELTSPTCELYIPPVAVSSSHSTPTHSIESDNSLADDATEYFSNQLAEGDSSFNSPLLETFQPLQHFDGDTYS